MLSIGCAITKDSNDIIPCVHHVFAESRTHGWHIFVIILQCSSLLTVFCSLMILAFLSRRQPRLRKRTLSASFSLWSRSDQYSLLQT
ncbi:hypothetical protein BDR04DRAFT_885136 [Suillus decipiens]|nr:hypothetical protein BDR04DRAFT_885136 [Suillus decipiens]